MAEDKHLRAVQEATVQAGRLNHRLGAGRSNQPEERFEGRCTKCNLLFRVKGTKIEGEVLERACSTRR